MWQGRGGGSGRARSLQAAVVQGRRGGVGQPRRFLAQGWGLSWEELRKKWGGGRGRPWRPLGPWLREHPRVWPSTIHPGREEALAEFLNRCMSVTLGGESAREKGRRRQRQVFCADVGSEIPNKDENREFTALTLL